MHRFLAQPIVMTDFGGPEALGELLSTLSQLEATVNQVLSQISGRVEVEKQKVDAVGVRLDSCRGRLHGLAQERYNKATIVTSPSRYPAPAQLPEQEVLFRSSDVSSPMPGDNAFKKKPAVAGLPHLSLNSSDPFSLDDAVGMCFDKEQQPIKKSPLKSGDVRADAARLHGLTSVSDLLVFSPSDRQNRSAAVPNKSRQLSLDQKLGAAPATISGDIAWDKNVVPLVDLRHHPVMAPIRLRVPRNLTGLSMVAQDIAFVDKQERSEGDEIDEDLPLPEFADDKYFPSKVVRAPLNGSRQVVAATSDLIVSGVESSAQAFPTAEAIAAGVGVVPFPTPEVGISHPAIDQLPEFDLPVPPRPTAVESPNNNGDAAGRVFTASDGAHQPLGCLLLPIPPPLPDVPAVELPFKNELEERSAAWAQRRQANVPQPPVAPPAPANPCVVRDASSAQAAGREEPAQPANNDNGDERSVTDILRDEFAKRGFDVANGRTPEADDEEGDEWEEKDDDEWWQHEVDHEAVGSIRSFF